MQVRGRSKRVSKLIVGLVIALPLAVFGACSLEEGGVGTVDAGGGDAPLDQFVGPDATVDSPADAPGTDAPMDSPPPMDVQVDAGPLAPSAISGLEFWVRSDVVATDEAGVVTSWNDQSGKGDSNRNAVPTGASGPVVTDAGYGFPALAFFPNMLQGSWLKTGNWSAAIKQPFTVMVIGEGAKYFVDSLDGNNQSAVLTVGTEVHMFAGGTQDLKMGGPPSPKRQIIGVFSGAASEIHNNQLSATAFGNPGNNGFQGLTLGNYASSTAGFSLSGYLVEVAVWSRVLTPVEMISLYKYGSSRYGFAVVP